MRRGQAAMEYLITYGWGILAMLIVVGALAYFGFLSPTRYLPSRCDFGSQLSCEDYQLQSNPAGNGYVLIRVRNNFGDDINITKAWTGTSALTVEYAYPPNPWAALPSQGIGIVKGNLSPQLRVTLVNPIVLTKGDRYSVPLTFEFKRDLSGAPVHNVSGEIFSSTT